MERITIFTKTLNGNAMSRLNNFHYAISLAQTLYDIEGDDDDLEEIGLVAYNFIGNKNTRLYRASLDINC
jgi:hypothetical protein